MEEAILQNGWIISSPLLYFNSRNLNDSNSSSFIRFQWVLHDSAELFVNFWKFPQITEGAPNFLGGTNSADRLNYLVRTSAFPFQKFKELKFFVIHCTSMSSNWFTSTFLNFFRFFEIKKGGPNFLVGTNSAERLNYLVCPSVFQFQKSKGLKSCFID